MSHQPDSEGARVYVCAGKAALGLLEDDGK